MYNIEIQTMLKPLRFTRKRLFPVLLLVLFMAAAGFGLPQKQKPKYGGVFRLKALSDEFRVQLDPADPDSFIFISEQLFDGLVRLDKNLNVMPALAEYWEISRDGKTYTFYLRKGVTFHNGKKLTAADVKYSLERIIDRETGSPYFQFFLSRVEGADDFRNGSAEDVRGFRVRDETTFEIEWTIPYVSALYLMSMHFCKILPQETARERNFFRRPQGTGPFKFDSWVRDTRLEVVGIRLIRNDDYFMGRPYVDAVEYSPRFNLDHFMGQEIDSIPVLSERLLRPPFQIYEEGPLHQIYLGLSCHLQPLDNPNVRRAIAWAVNKSRSAHALDEPQQLYEVSNAFIPSRLPGFFPDSDEVTFSPEKARNLLASEGVLENFPTLNLLLPHQRSESRLRFFRELRSQLEQVGIRLRVKYYKSLDEIDSIDQPYLVLLERLMDIPDAENIVRPLFHSKSLFNLCRYSNPQLDELLQKAEVERSWSKRIEYFHRMEEILLMDTPAIPLFYKRNRIAMQPYVRGVEVPLMGLYYLDACKIWLDK